MGHHLPCLGSHLRRPAEAAQYQTGPHVLVLSRRGALRRRRQLQPPRLPRRPIPGGLLEARPYSWPWGHAGVGVLIGGWYLERAGLCDMDCTSLVKKEQRGALVGDEIYFLLEPSISILKYDLGNHSLSVIDSPGLYGRGVVLVPTADGSLGFIGSNGSSLYLWSRKVNPNGAAGWVQCGVIELEKLIPYEIPCHKADVIGFAEGVDLIFVKVGADAFTIEPKARQVTKVSKPGDHKCKIVPFMSFYTQVRW
uniref:F-box protein AT5G49610-like beta-propeller domain-containing protein n=1 Tax=Arundo donax TaxID=35708 RepID=A0A0A9GPJ6_ARUDO